MIELGLTLGGLAIVFFIGYYLKGKIEHIKRLQAEGNLKDSIIRAKNDQIKAEKKFHEDIEKVREAVRNKSEEELLEDASKILPGLNIDDND